MTSGLSGVLPSRDLKSLKSDDDGLCDGRVNQGVGLGGILPPKKSALCDTLGTLCYGTALSQSPARRILH